MHVWMTVTSWAVSSCPLIRTRRSRRDSPPRKKKPSRPAAMLSDGMTPARVWGGGGRGGDTRGGGRTAYLGMAQQA